jgi:hypothetical protein
MRKITTSLFAVALALGSLWAVGAAAQTSNAVVVSACGTPPASYPAGSNRQVTQDTTGKLCTGASVTPGGTQDTNLKQVNGSTVNVGTGASSTGTQRVAVSSDSTINSNVDSVTDGTPVTTSVSSATTFPSINTVGFAAIHAEITAGGTSNNLQVDTSVDNITWQNGSGQLLRTDTVTPQIPTATANAVSAGQVYTIPVTAPFMRLRVSSYNSGTVTLTQTPKRNAIVAVGSTVAQGVGTAGSPSGGVVSVQGVASGTALNVSPDNVVDGTTTTASVTSAATVLTFANTAGYGYIEVGVSSAGSSNNIQVDTAADGSTYTNTTGLIQRSDITNSTVSTTSSTLAVGQTFIIPITTQAMRVRVSTYTSGTVTLYGTLKRGTPVLPAIVVFAFGNVPSSTADSGAPIKIGGVSNTNPLTLTNGQRGDLQLAPSGSVFTEESGRSFTNITTATTTTIKSGKGNLHAMCINTDAGSATITAYDNTAGSGTKIFTITNPVTLLSMGPICATYDLAFATGLTIVTTGVQDITFTWR